MLPSETHLQVDHPTEVHALLEGLSEPGGASLSFGDGGGEPIPALLMSLVPEEYLLIDITAVREIAESIEKGTPVRLLGQAKGAMLTTPPLQFLDWVEQEGRLQFRCAYPEHVQIVHRREVYRAELGPGMNVAANLYPDPGNEETRVTGKLKNLSLGGCLIELPLVGAMRLTPGQPVDALELCFPNRQSLSLSASVRHMQTDGEQQVKLGCKFENVVSETERRLWFYVREIERESARSAVEGNRELSPSALFSAEEPVVPSPSARPHGADYATPMARRMAKVAAYLDGVLLRLLDGGDIDSTPLSRHSDQLLGLLEEDREAALFATVCLVDEPRLIQHGIAVAVRLGDLATAYGLPRDARKALVASALVHDLGKALLPRELRQARHLEPGQRSQLAAHVDLLHARLGQCRWLSSAVSHAAIVAVNERLDGSGYPHGRAADELDELSRMAMVVDVADAMGRYRPDRPARSASEVYRHLLGHPEAFDRNWVQRYVRHFGLTPVGSLVRFASGELGWVQRLDRQGRPLQVQLTAKAEEPGSDLGDVVRDARLASLGKPESMVVPRITRQVPLF